jgi:L-alanine-DL-glutamate epimerase-like enolase superfamily enzyme
METIASIRCVAYYGTMEHPGEFWADGVLRPAEIYPGTLPETPLQRSGVTSYALRSVFVHVETSRGLVGTGGPITDHQALIIRQALAPVLLGRDALATEQLWDIMYRTSVHGRKGTEMMAVSALDCALWDLKGKHFRVPVHVLLGGPVRDSIPAYASALGHSLELGQVRETVRDFVRQGYRGTKWFPRHGPADGRAGMAENMALFEALREAAGSGIDIMIDAWMSWDVPYTLAMADRLGDVAPRWIEEPVMPDKQASYAEITRRISHGIAVAGGEHEYTRWGLKALMDVRAVHVYQPDTYWAGGISEMMKIAALATTCDVELIPHGHSVPANANLSFALPAPTTPLLEFLVKWNVVHQYFLLTPVRPVDGLVLPPTELGLGMELDADRIESHEELR